MSFYIQHPTDHVPIIIIAACFLLLPFLESRRCVPAAADQIGFSPAGRALEVEDGAMCHKSILSTRYYHSTSDGLTAAHMAQGGAAPPLSESGRTLFVWLDVGQMMRTRNPGRCDGERRWYLLAVAGSRITSRHVLQLPPTVSQSVCHGHYSGMSVRVWRRPADLARNGGSCDGRSFQLPTSKTPPLSISAGTTRHACTPPPHPMFIVVVRC